MKKRLLLLSTLIGVGCSLQTMAQDRYKDLIFTNAQIMVTSDVQYGTNQALNLSPGGGNPFPQALKMDVYQPNQNADTVSHRPVVIVLHSGNFLPPIANGSPVGSRKDSSIVEACNQFAKRGYVAIAVSYRLGWNPIAGDEEVRRGTLLQAVYRAILDTKTSIRFLRKEEATNGNPYKIDKDKIAIYGHGTDGYVSLATAYLSSEAETQLPKFLSQISDGGLFVQGQSYIIPALMGNIDGTGGIAELNTYEYPGYSNAVNMVMNVGGALADTSWINPGEAAVSSVHCIRDPFAPFNSGIVVVPTTQGDVVDVQGANVFINNANAKGVNDAFNNLLLSGDQYTARARSLYNQTYTYDIIDPTGSVAIANPDGLFPINLPSRTVINRFANEGAPWDWWDLNVLTAQVAGFNAATGQTVDVNVLNGNNVVSNPNMGPEKGRAYIDTAVSYFCPRIMRQMQIGNWEALAVKQLEADNAVQVYPNPSNGQITLSSAVMVKQVELYDITGKQVFTSNVNNFKTVINTSVYTEGLYILKVYTENGIQTSKLIIK